MCIRDSIGAGDGPLIAQRLLALARALEQLAWEADFGFLFLSLIHISEPTRPY